ncbi:MAG TPA: carbohydrate kinase family protein [Ktedonobacterales bacterium]|jgi:sugar/nucleoside kinase (ribokinase family)
MPGQIPIHTIDLVGDVVWDTHLIVPHLPAPTAEARATSRQRRLGGTAGHVARWLHLLEQAGFYPTTPPTIRVWATLDSKAAAELAFCDLTGSTFVEQGAEVYVLALPDGEKAMMSYVPPDLPKRTLPSKSALFYLSAYTLLVGDALRDIVEPCEALAAKGALLVFDLAPLIHQMERKLVLRLVSKARVAIGNDEEWQHLFFQEKSSSRRARAALELGAGCVHLKRGAKGAQVFWASGGGIEIVPPSTQAINTTGAGDAYTAALLACLVAGRDDNYAARLASFCGTLHTEQRSDAENIAALQNTLATMP